MVLVIAVPFAGTGLIKCKKVFSCWHTPFVSPIGCGSIILGVEHRLVVGKAIIAILTVCAVFG